MYYRLPKIDPKSLKWQFSADNRVRRVIKSEGVLLVRMIPNMMRVNGFLHHFRFLGSDFFRNVSNFIPGFSNILKLCLRFHAYSYYVCQFSVLYHFSGKIFSKFIGFLPNKGFCRRWLNRKWPKRIKMCLTLLH